MEMINGLLKKPSLMILNDWITTAIAKFSNSNKSETLARMYVFSTDFSRSQSCNKWLYLGNGAV